MKAELDAYAKEIEELRARNQQMEAQLRLAGSTDAPGATMLGFLLKRGGGTRFGGSRKWRERYVVVEQGTLAYFGSENAYKIGKAPLKRRYIPLANYTLDSMTSSIAEFKLVPVRTKTLAAYRRDPSSMCVSRPPGPCSPLLCAALLTPRSRQPFTSTPTVHVHACAQAVRRPHVLLQSPQRVLQEALAGHHLPLRHRRTQVTRRAPCPVAPHVPRGTHPQ